jgi:hypothetical protein
VESLATVLFESSRGVRNTGMGLWLILCKRAQKESQDWVGHHLMQQILNNAFSRKDHQSDAARMWAMALSGSEGGERRI